MRLCACRTPPQVELSAPLLWPSCVSRLRPPLGALLIMLTGMQQQAPKTSHASAQETAADVTMLQLQQRHLNMTHSESNDQDTPAVDKQLQQAQQMRLRLCEDGKEHIAVECPCQVL